MNEEQGISDSVDFQRRERVSERLNDLDHVTSRMRRSACMVARHGRRSCWLKRAYEWGGSHTSPLYVSLGMENGILRMVSFVADLAEIVAVWPELPEHIKAAIKTLVQTCDKGVEWRRQQQ